MACEGKCMTIALDRPTTTTTDYARSGAVCSEERSSNRSDMPGQWLAAVRARVAENQAPELPPNRYRDDSYHSSMPVSLMRDDGIDDW